MNILSGITKKQLDLVQYFRILTLYVFQTLAGFARKNLNRHDLNSVLSIFPVVKHLRSIKPEFDRNLEVC